MMGHAGMAAAAVRYLRSVGAPTSRTPEPYDPHPRAELRAVRDGERAPVGGAEFRQVLGRFASGVTVITAPDPDGSDGPAGFACQSFSSLSLDPPLVVFMVGRTSTTWPRIARAGTFCVNVLGEGQGELCRGFAVPGGDKFAGVTHRPAPVTGAPLLAGVTAWVDCTVHAVHTGGDHLIVVGRVEALGTGGDGDPLIFHEGQFRRLE
ncbi:flavin reductase family protein [Streptomyces qinzhouensis]|uniref:Flavin reductase family protein n=1 Tax=Streptomyces qinzhouensis TaxID=2599401 RepID=A0A5B8J7X0_9ACTN|nr:flavin reductase family protein [Streptomyces qinzhouensis]QDY77356.1 flavin reductase family protein [Streptomyces qinzhouensis]